VRCGGPRDQATLHFFWLCVAFFGVFTFSFNGPFDRLDWVFYWGDAVAFALLPPLLLHFTMVFPERPSDEPSERSSDERLASILVPLMYLPALALGAARVIAIVRGRRAPCRARCSRASRHTRSPRAGVPVRLRPSRRSACSWRAFPEITSRHGEPAAALDRVGTGARVGPFAVGYALP